MNNSELHKIYLPFPEKGDRAVWVYIPNHNDGEKLPVIYMTDGQNLFEKNMSSDSCWYVEKAVENEI